MGHNHFNKHRCIISHKPNPRFWGLKINTLMWIRLPKQKLAKPLTVPEKQKQDWRNKLPNTLIHLHIFPGKKQMAT